MTLTFHLRTRAALVAWLLAHRGQRVSVTLRPDGTVLGHVHLEAEEMAA